MRSRGRQRRWRLAVAGIVVTVALSLVVNIATSTVSIPKSLWWTSATWVAVILLLITAIALKLADRSQGEATGVEGNLQQSVHVLADEVYDQWTKEIARQHALQPVPLRVRWSSTARPVAASRDVVLDEPSGSDWGQFPLEGNVEQIVTAFRGLPHRQLVVLGEPGAGKSVLVALLTQRLAKDPDFDEAVPVLFSIASWNPVFENIETFAIRRLVEDYNFLRDRQRDGRSLAELLVARGRLLLVLDGLDELPVDRHTGAIESLDRFAAANHPLIVTCRTTEYEEAVLRAGVILSRAAVVEIEPVEAEDAIEFLSHPAPARPRWLPVFKHIRRYPRSAIAQALSTPLMVTLARYAFRPATTKPADLLRLPDAEAVSRALLDGFITAVYRPDEPVTRGKGRRLRRYSPDQAARWLGCMGYHLHLAYSRDLMWWQLTPGLLSPWPARTRRRVAITAIAISGLIAGLATGVAAGAVSAVPVAVLTMTIIFVNGTGKFQMLWSPKSRSYMVWRWEIPSLGHTVIYFVSPQGRFLRICAGLGSSVLAGLITGILIKAPLFGSGVGLLCGFVLGLMSPWSNPVSTHPGTPRKTIAANHRATAIAAVQHGIISGIIFSTVAALTLPASRVPIVGITAAFVYAAAAADGAGLSKWIQYKLAHATLVAHRWLPWRLWAFLDDAYERGMLRQAGSYYQFRHALLQDHLAHKILDEHLRACARAGNWNTASRLARLYAEQGSVDEAIAILRPPAEMGNYAAGESLDQRGLFRPSGRSAGRRLLR